MCHLRVCDETVGEYAGGSDNRGGTCGTRFIQYGFKNLQNRCQRTVGAVRIFGVKLNHLSLSQEEVIQAVEKVCTFLPSSLSAQCKDLIETYGQAIIELLVQQADPKTVCTVLALCNDGNRAYVRKFSLEFAT